MKKIEIKLKDINKLEFELKTSAEKGDYISLSEMEKISFDNLKSELNNKRDEILNEMWSKHKDAMLSSSIEFKNMSKELIDAKDLLQKNEIKFEKEKTSIERKIEKENKKIISELEANLSALKLTRNNEIETEIQKAVLKKEIELNKLNSQLETSKNKMLELNEKITSLNEKHTIDKENLEIKIESKITKEFASIVKKLEKEISIKEKEIDYNEKIFASNKKAEILEIKNEFKEKYEEIIKSKDEEIDKLERNRNLMNIKEIGEGLEKWMISEASNYLSYKNTSFRKTNTSIDGTKPDFIFEIMNDDKSILSSVTIEAKSETLTAKSKKKNIEHIEKLEVDRKKNNSEYSLLVTELESDDQFIFKKVGEYDNMYMVRPKYFIPFLHLIYNLEIKRMDISKLEIDFKEKQEILKEFESFKVDILEKTINDISTNIEKIETYANTSIKATENIIETSRILNRHIGTLENKFNKFKIQKLVERIK